MIDGDKRADALLATGRLKTSLIEELRRAGRLQVFGLRRGRRRQCQYRVDRLRVA
jgi:hypothetical protein